MKTFANKLFSQPALGGGLGLMLTGRVAAQTFTTLHGFSGISDGAYPQSGLLSSGNILYGTMSFGLSFVGNSGAVFKLNPDGTGFIILHRFGPGSPGGGALPYGALVLLGNTLYGTGERGGDFNTVRGFA